MNTPSSSNKAASTLIVMIGVSVRRPLLEIHKSLNFEIPQLLISETQIRRRLAYDIDGSKG